MVAELEPNSGNKGRDNLGGLSVVGRTVVKWRLWKQSVRVWTGFKWFRIRTSSVLFWTRQRTSGFR